MDIKQRAKISMEMLNARGMHFTERVITDLLTALEQTEAERDRYKEALEMIAGKRMCVDNLMSNVDIARQTLAGGDK